MKVGVQIHPQNTTMADLRAGWQGVDELGVDSLWTWDHFFPPLYGAADEAHFEGWQILSAMAVTTSNVTQIGMLVTEAATAIRTCWPTWRAPSTTCRAVGPCWASDPGGWTRTRSSTATPSAHPDSDWMPWPRRYRGFGAGSACSSPAPSAACRS